MPKIMTTLQPDGLVLVQITDDDRKLLGQIALTGDATRGVVRDLTRLAELADHVEKNEDKDDRPGHPSGGSTTQ